MKKYLFFVFVLFCMNSGVKADGWNGAVAERYDGGMGTSDAPYVIASAEQLARLAQRTNSGLDDKSKCFILTADIDVSAQEWTAIGRASVAFVGTLDGRGHKVTFQIENGTGDCQGLFGVLGNGARVTNLLVAGSVSGSADYMGGIAGINNATIEDCYSAVNVTMTASASFPSSSGIGCIAGKNTASVTYCSASGLVESNSYTDHAGSIVGVNVDFGKTLDCHHTSEGELTNVADSAYNAGHGIYAAGLDSQWAPKESYDLKANTVDGIDYYTTFYTLYGNYEVGSGITIYSAVVTGEGSTELELHALDGSIIPSGEAVVLVGGADALVEKEGKWTFPLSLTGDAASHMTGVNELKGYDVRTETPDYSFNYVLGAVEDVMGFYRYTGTYLPANKAYVQVDRVVSYPAALRMTFRGTTTSLAPASVEEPSSDAETFYTLQGQRINASQIQRNHIYVVRSRFGDGRKYMKK